MHDLDAVKRALVRADVKALAARTSMPEHVTMAVVVSCGWDVARAEATIVAALHDTIDAVSHAIEAELLHGGGMGGGKVARLDTLGKIPPPRGVITGCVS